MEIIRTLFIRARNQDPQPKNPSNRPRWHGRSIFGLIALVASVAWPAATSANSPSAPSATGTWTNGRFQFRLQARPNDVYLIQASPDLVNWTVVATNQADAQGLVIFTDHGAAGLDRRYYRGQRLTVAAPSGAAFPRPMLVLTNGTNPFSQYCGEILLAEGLNGFAFRDVSSVSSNILAPYDVVVLGQMPLTAEQVTALGDWVAAGGNLVAMQPDKQLAGLLGLEDAGGILAEGYLLVNAAAGPGAGIVRETMQFHGTADRYTLGSASSVATLYANATTATSHPAVTLRSVGSNGGQAAAFTFDLARSIALTRQGNPAWAGQDRDGIPPVRSDDLFFGAASFDPQPDWIDFNKVAIPQADEQQRLLANLIQFMAADRKPLPRFWYFPNGHRAAVVMTGDDHANGGTARRFDDYVAYSAPKGSVENWETIRGSSYIYPNSPMTDAEAAAYEAAGFEISLHLNTGCADYTAASLDAFFTDQLNQFRARFPSVTSPKTHRMHCIAWSGYTLLPEVGLRHGIRLDTTYYYYPSGWVGNRPGYFTGSGMPMRFATTNGNVVDVYQAATQLTDESNQSYPQTVDLLLDRALGSEEYYSALVANMHTDYNPWPDSDNIVLSARHRGVPVISARQLLTWTDGRNRSSLHSVDGNLARLTFSVDADADALGLQVMVPVPAGSQVDTARYSGSPIGYFLRMMKGIQYAFLPALSGNYEIVYAPDTAAPGVKGVRPGSEESEVSRSTEVSVTFTEAMNASTLNADTITLLDSFGNVVPATVSYNPSAFTAVLKPGSPLRALETHSVRVIGGVSGARDLAGNPLASDFASSFTTTPGYTIWENRTSPSVPAANDTNPIELGVKFKSGIAGNVTGIRFYKGPGNTGTHVGKLWTATGSLLASVTFTNESALGWQQQALAAPIAIDSNMTYVVSYHAPAGRYSADVGYFAADGVDNAPLRALANGEDGGNGVYRYGTGGFPDQTFNSANYWVDLVFEPETTTPTLTVTATDAAAAEPADPGAFTIRRTGSRTALTVNYTLAGTAVNGTDYETLSGSVALPAGSSSVTVPLMPKDDLTLEDPETVVLTLSSGAAYAIGSPDSALATIASDDRPHILKFFLHGSETPGTAGGFTMDQEPAPGQPVAVDPPGASSWFSEPALTGVFHPGAKFALVVPGTLGLHVALDVRLAVTNPDGSGEQLLGQTTQTLGLAPQTITIPVTTPVGLNNQRLKLTISSAVGLNVNLQTGTKTFLQATEFVGTP